VALHAPAERPTGGLADRSVCRAGGDRPFDGSCISAEDARTTTDRAGSAIRTARPSSVPRRRRSRSPSLAADAHTNRPPWCRSPRERVARSSARSREAMRSRRGFASSSSCSDSVGRPFAGRRSSWPTLRSRGPCSGSRASAGCNSFHVTTLTSPVRNVGAPTLMARVDHRAPHERCTCRTRDRSRPGQGWPGPSTVDYLDQNGLSGASSRPLAMRFRIGHPERREPSSRVCARVCRQRGCRGAVIESVQAPPPAGSGLARECASAIRGNTGVRERRSPSMAGGRLARE